MKRALSVPQERLGREGLEIEPLSYKQEAVELVYGDFPGMDSDELVRETVLDIRR